MISKKQVNLRMNPGTVEWIKEIQQEMLMRGFSWSQAEVVEEAIGQLHKKMGLRPDKYEEE